MEMKKYFLAILLMLLAQISWWVPVAEADTQAPQQTILLNEILPGSATSASQEFIELYNPGNSDVSLNGWIVQYASATGTTWKTLSGLAFGQDSIGAHSYYPLTTANYLPAANTT